MTKRRLMLPLALAIVLTVVPLAGCGRSPAPTTPPASTAAATTEAPTPSPTPVPTPTPTPRPVVTVRGMLQGSEPGGMGAVLAELNDRLGAELSTQLELSWAKADKYDENVAAAVASDAKPDFFWCASSKLGDYAEKGLIAPLDELMAQFGADISKNIDAALFDTMKVGGKLVGIPSSGNMPLKGGGQAFIYREDLRAKYNLPKPDSLANIELFLSTVAQNEPGLFSLSTKNAALVALWASGSADFLAGTNNAVICSAGGDGAVTCAAPQAAEVFKQSVLKARQWYQAGWIHKSILASKDPAADVPSGAAAATAGSAASVPAMQQALSAKQADAALSVQPLAGAMGFIDGNGGNALCIVQPGAAQDRAMELINWIYASQANYDLICYGVEGVNYSLAGERIAPQGDGYAGFPSHIFANLNYMRFPSGTPDDCVETMKRWNEGAALSPLYGFAFDPAAVKDEIAKAKTVYTNYAAMMLSGSGDAATLLTEFGAKMTAAGQDKIVAEAQKQVNAFLAAR